MKLYSAIYLVKMIKTRLQRTKPKFNVKSLENEVDPFSDVKSANAPQYRK